MGSVSKAGLDLTTVLLTYNEELNLPECLESLRCLDSQVVVVDSGSADHTREIAVDSGAQVVEHVFENYGAQRNWALQNIPIETEWVLNIDADERLTPELRDSIAGALAGPPDEVNGYLLRRRTVFLGQWIKHGGHYPSYHARLFRKGKGRCEDRLYDQHFIVEGKVEQLSGDMIDETNHLADWWARHARWAKMEAQEILYGDASAGRLKGNFDGSPIERRRWLRQRVYYRLPLFVRPALYYIYRYFIRLGFLDGRRGFVFHLLQGFSYRFKVDVHILKLRLGTGGGDVGNQPEVVSKPNQNVKPTE